MKFTIISGLGRCGTTLLHQAIYDCSIIKKTEFVVDLQGYNFSDECLYKTHDFAPDFLPGHPKVIFMFGNPRNTVSSFHSFDDTINIYNRLHANHSDSCKYYLKDTLRLEALFDSWYKPQTFDLMTIRYETMHEYMFEIQNFLDTNFDIPAKKSRGTNWKLDPHYKDLSTILVKLDQKIKDADDIKVWPKNKEI
jgi:hypothetical protein